jgi:phosphatidylglycerophosphate synthase
MERLFIAITVSRLGLAVGLVQSVEGAFKWSALWLTLVIAADVPNGIAARRFNADTNRRRIADSVVDRITVGSACTAMALSRPEVSVALLPLALRGAVVLAVSAVCFVRKNTIVTGGQLHKIGSLTTGAMGFVILSRLSCWPVAVAVATLISWVLLLDYLPQYRLTLTAPRPAALYRRRTRH